MQKVYLAPLADSYYNLKLTWTYLRRITATVKTISSRMDEDAAHQKPPNPNQMPSNEKVNSFLKTIEGHDLEYFSPHTADAPPQDAIVENEGEGSEGEEKEGEENERIGERLPHLNLYRDCLLRSPAYKWLLSRLQRELTLECDEHNSMVDIRNTITSSLPRVSKISKREPVKTTKAALIVDWNPATFFQTQDFEGPDGVKVEPSIAVETAVTLTGSVVNAQAVTCQQYLCQTWPLVGEDMIRLLKKVVLNPPHEAQRGEF